MADVLPILPFSLVHGFAIPCIFSHHHLSKSLTVPFLIVYNIHMEISINSLKLEDISDSLCKYILDTFYNSNYKF